MNAIQAENIHKHYGDLHVLKGVNLTISKGEIVAIVGASGAGKTTLLQILGTLTKATKGHLQIGDTVISTLNDSKLAAFRNKELGFIFQFHQLLPEFTALENVCIPAYIKGTSKQEAETRAEQLLKHLDLLDRKDHKPNALSGGEQQRVAVARALINNPSLILADEPSGNLDSANAETLHKLFLNLRDTFGFTFVIVTHNNELASMADRILEMRDGHIISQ